MYTSLVLVALAGWSVSSTEREEAPTVTWAVSYAKAREEGRRATKPLAVFVGKGVDGWKDLAREKDLSARAVELLRANYVCVFADTDTTAGRQLADALEVQTVGLVISSSDGTNQAFRHAGTLSTATLERTLQTYSDSRRVVTTTDTLVSTTVPTGYTPGVATSAIPSAAPFGPGFVPSYAPAFGGFGGYGGFGGFGGFGGCPGGRCR